MAVRVPNNAKMENAFVAKGAQIVAMGDVSIHSIMPVTAELATMLAKVIRPVRKANACAAQTAVTLRCTARAAIP